MEVAPKFAELRTEPTYFSPHTLEEEKGIG